MYVAIVRSPSRVYQALVYCHYIAREVTHSPLLGGDSKPKSRIDSVSEKTQRSVDAISSILFKESL